MMPCDTPPPPSSLDDMNQDGDVEDDIIDLDESMYDFIETDELEIITHDDSLRTFSGHKESVFCCSFDKTVQYIATGSQDETAIVWNVSDGTVKFECTGHKDSVIFANFSHDSKYVASADMSGLVQVFDVDDGSLAWSFDTYEFTWASWFRKSNILLGGSADGSCWKWSIPDGASTAYENAGVGTSFGAASKDDQKLAVGYCDGKIRFWDLNTDSNIGSLSGVSAFKGSVTTMEYNQDNSLMLAASENGTVKLIKMSDLKVLWNINVCEGNDHDDISVEAVGFCNIPSLIVVGTNSGFLGIYDISSKTRRFSVVLNCAIAKIICDESTPIIYAALTAGALESYDIRTGQQVKTWTGHKATLLDLDISSDKKYLLTCSDDHTCKIFDLHS